MKTSKFKRILAGIVSAAVIASCGLAALPAKTVQAASKNSDKIVIYSNADDEAVTSMKKTLDENGYKDQYIFQTYGTNELGPKLIAEGTDIEADIVTMSSYYLESAQQKNHMFKKLTFDRSPLQKYPNYYAPFLANQGAIFVNTKVMKEKNLPMPKSVKDLAKSVYKGQLSVVDIQGSSTAWLMVQSLLDNYGTKQTKKILKGIYKNAGENLEQSGSGPIKKVRAGEVAVGFGLRHQAVADKENGLPIDYVDPTEGNYTLTESLAVVKHSDKKKVAKAQKMVKTIIQKGRSDLMKTYPMPLYKGEKEDANGSKNSKVYPKKMTVNLLKKHIKLSESCKTK
ncbi:MAG: extracellular solute-binding protein [Pseudoramibacter sp.]|jgi:ABC-type Fe3+ transport system substrate-binding protein